MATGATQGCHVTRFEQLERRSHLSASELDAGFGIDGTLALFDFPGSPQRIITDSNDKVIVVGTAPAEAIIGRYNPDGTLDRNFASQGFWTKRVSLGNQGNGSVVVTSLIGQQDSSVLVELELDEPTIIQPQNQVVALDPFGRVDPRFRSVIPLDRQLRFNSNAAHSTIGLMSFNSGTAQLVKYGISGSITHRYTVPMKQVESYLPLRDGGAVVLGRDGNESVPRIIRVDANLVPDSRYTSRIVRVAPRRHARGRRPRGRAGRRPDRLPQHHHRPTC
jgi:hypothetical protein